MAIIYCDKCHFELRTEDIVFQEIELNEAEGTKMRFYQCPECGEEYIVDVTDRELRKKISILKKMKRKYVRMFHAKESETRLRNYGERLERFQSEVLAHERELRKRWTGAQ